MVGTDNVRSCSLTLFYSMMPFSQMNSFWVKNFETPCTSINFQKTVIYSGAGISVSAGIGQAAKSGNGKMMGGAGTDAKYDD